ERSGSAGRPAGACPWPPASARSASAALRISGAENWNGACFIMKQIRLFIQLFVGHHASRSLATCALRQRDRSTFAQIEESRSPRSVGIPTISPLGDGVVAGPATRHASFQEEC